MKLTRRAARSTRKQERLTLPPEGVLRLGVVADTHSSPHPRTLELLTSLRPAAILHAGDIGDFGVLRDLATVAPVIAVRGNIDPVDVSAPDVFVIDVANGESTLLRILLTHIAVNGPMLRADAARLAREEGAGLVICGHSHVPFIGKHRGIGVFNPGSIGPRRFALPIVFGVLEVSSDATRMRHIDCETGSAWLPPALSL